MSTQKSELYRPFQVDSLDVGKTRNVKVAAEGPELQEIAERIGVNAVQSFSAECQIQRLKDGCTIHVSGQLKGQIVQDCVATLSPITSDVSDDFQAWFLDDQAVVSFKQKQQKQAQTEKYEMSGMPGEVPMLDEEEDPEPISNGEIDLGDVAVQFLALVINPFPDSRSEDADPVEHKEFAKESPFAALETLKSK